MKREKTKWGFYAPPSGILDYDMDGQGGWVFISETINDAHATVRISLITNRKFRVCLTVYPHVPTEKVLNSIEIIETTVRKAMITGTEWYREWEKEVQKDERLFCPFCDLPLQYIEYETNVRVAPVEPNGVVRFDKLSDLDWEIAASLRCQKLADGRGCGRQYHCTLSIDGGRNVVDTVDFGDVEVEKGLLAELDDEENTISCVSCGLVTLDNPSDLHLCTDCQGFYNLKAFWADRQGEIEAVNVCEFNYDKKVREKYWIVPR